MHSTPDQNLTPELKVIPSNSTSSGDDAKPEPPIDKELERKAVLKLDYTVLPMMALFYFLNFMVRRRDYIPFRPNQADLEL